MAKIGYSPPFLFQNASAGQWTTKAIDSNLKISVPTADIIHAQLERAATSGSDLQSAIDARKKQLDKKRTKTQTDLQKLRDKMAKSGYDHAVPAAVKEKNR
jgi:valyl-tRNA synthetase